MSEVGQIRLAKSDGYQQGEGRGSGVLDSYGAVSTAETVTATIIFRATSPHRVHQPPYSGARRFSS